MDKSEFFDPLPRFDVVARPGHETQISCAEQGQVAALFSYACQMSVQNDAFVVVCYKGLKARLGPQDDARRALTAFAVRMRRCDGMRLRKALHVEDLDATTPVGSIGGCLAPLGKPCMRPRAVRGGGVACQRRDGSCTEIEPS